MDEEITHQQWQRRDTTHIHTTYAKPPTRE
jgi:hypothetical protein